jgi:5-methylcytosine-specific restriction endonuclease McrA
MESKKCSKCGQEKRVTEFHKQSKTKDGYNVWCKACVREYQQDLKVKEKRRISAYLWSVKNKDKLRDYSQSTHGKEVKRKAQSKYLKTYKGKTANKRRKHKRRAIMENAGTFTNEEWQDRLLEYNYCCAYCYKPFPVDELTIDHMQPLSRGGTNTIDNLVPACISCNSRKLDKTPLEMLQKGLM